MPMSDDAVLQEAQWSCIAKLLEITTRLSGVDSFKIHSKWNKSQEPKSIPIQCKVMVDFPSVLNQ
jgi:hypothetical protein